MKTIKRLIALLMIVSMVGMDCIPAIAQEADNTVLEDQQDVTKDTILETDSVDTDEFCNESVDVDMSSEEDDKENIEEKEEIKPVGVAEDTGTVISAENIFALPGEMAEVNVSVKNNPGILGLVLKLTYDDDLELVEATGGEALDYLTFSASGTLASPCRFVWDGVSCSDEDAKDGTILKLKFKVSEDAEVWKKHEIRLDANKEDIFDKDINMINTEIENGEIYVSAFIPGDVNGDKKVNSTDVVLIRRYIVGGYNVTINENAANVNDDLNINSADITLIRRYITGGYDVKLTPPTRFRCEHEKTFVKKVEPTCTENGAKEHWYCSECDRYFSDEEGKHELYPNDIVLPALGHTEVVIPAVPATTTSPGYTEGLRCSVCDKILIEPQPIPDDFYSIKYDVINGDEYLKTIPIVNDNPTSIIKGGSVYLEDLTAEGYRFLGWFDASEGGNRVQKIENADHNYSLYAHWSSLEYTVQFKSDLVNADPIKYSSNEGKVLPVLTLDGYTFVGWSDENGKIIRRIEPGTRGNKILCANWISDRNQAWAQKKLDNPIIYENDDSIIFAYEIGEIRNVPLSVIEDFGKILQSGVSQEVDKDYTYQTSEQLVNEYTKAVEKSSVDTATWTLSTDWSEATQVNEEYCRQKGITVEEANRTGRSETGAWYVNNSKSGSQTDTVIDSTQTHNLTSITKNSATSEDFGFQTEIKNIYSHEVDTEKHIDATIGGKYSNSVGIDVAGLKASRDIEVYGNVTNGRKDIDKSSSSVETAVGSNMQVGTEVFEGRSDQQDVLTHKTTNSTATTSWNNEEGRSGSVTSSASTELSKALSECICETTGYGKSYIKQEGETQGFSNSEASSNKDEYSNAVTYSTIKSETTRLKYTTTNTKTGYHRWVMAGTAHVFGVVGYDIATKSYYVYTYSVMDDETHRFEDYSYNSSSYDDNQNSIIEFKIPYEVTDYVNSRVCETKGLYVDTDGTITEYTGSDNYVVIPDYKTIKNKDNGKDTVVVVKGFSEDTFKGNENITGVELSSYITSIPDGAFENCKNLYDFYADSVTSIGENAFKGTLISEWNLTSNLTSLSPGAFDGAESVVIDVANVGVLENLLNSQVDNITVDIGNMEGSLDGKTIYVPSTVKKFTLNGHDKEYRNLVIKSEAEETTINRLNISSDNEIPLQLSSDRVNLYQSKIDSGGVCAAFSSDEVTLDLYGTNILNSNNGDTAILCRKTNIIRSEEGLTTVLNIAGDWVCVTEPIGKAYVKFSRGEFKLVDNDAFDAMFTSHALSFDANGGQCTETVRNVPYGEAYGELPVPTRDYYTFIGWFTESGEKISKNTKMGETNVSVYARWTKNGESEWVLYSQVPEGAEITDNKWTYTQRSWITSGSSSVAGYTLDSSKTEVHESTSEYWSDWSDWTRTYNPSSTHKIVDSRQGSEKTGSRAVSYHLSSYCYMTPRGNRNYLNYKLDNITGAGYSASYGYYYNEATVSISDLASCASGDYGWLCTSIDYPGYNAAGVTGYAVNGYIMFIDGTNYEDIYSNYTEYRYSDLKYTTTRTYTYHLYKDEAKESMNEITAGGDISNVKRYVKYIKKSGEEVADTYHMFSYCYMTPRGNRNYLNYKIDDIAAAGYSTAYGEQYYEANISGTELALAESGAYGWLCTNIAYPGYNAGNAMGYAVNGHIMFVDN